MTDDRSDRVLMVALRDRQELSALDELVRRWDRRLVSFFAKCSGDAELARDLRQETYVRVWKSAGTYKEQYAFSTWVMRIATNLLRTALLRTHRYSEPFVALTSDVYQSPNADASLGLGDNLLTLQGALENLGVTDREIVLLRFQLELTFAEIAQVLGIPESTAKSRMTAVLRRLRNSLELGGMTKEDLHV